MKDHLEMYPVLSLQAIQSMAPLACSNGRYAPLPKDRNLARYEKTFQSYTLPLPMQESLNPAFRTILSSSPYSRNCHSKTLQKSP